MQARVVLQDTCPPGGDSETQLLGSLDCRLCRLIERLLNAPQQGSEWGDSERNFAASGLSVTANCELMNQPSSEAFDYICLRKCESLFVYQRTQLVLQGIKARGEQECSSAALFTHVRRKLAKPWGGDVRFRATKLKLCVSRCCLVGAVSSSGPTMAKSHVTFATDYSFPLIITCVHFLAWFSYSNQKKKKSDCHLPFPTAQESGHILMRLYLRGWVRA
ncbi:uncharacterized protein LOC122429878 isoform X1 [Cervus canadensis]|uniref:uncharacterized protein LOC122429878 isoform X1 n=1 Tax=Cervus canadensis TaxID=1574408 RepID=UPI001CA3610D|nr:uncharacterized protein LOC122429878 isoform X1 [Cervus canadensis]